MFWSSKRKAVAVSEPFILVHRGSTDLSLTISLLHSPEEEA